MAFGKLGGIKPAATTHKTLYKPASGKTAVVTVSVLNRAADTRTIRIGVLQNASADQSIADGDWLEARALSATGDASAKDRLLITGIALNGANDDQIVVYSDGADVQFLAMGSEENI